VASRPDLEEYLDDYRTWILGRYPPERAFERLLRSLPEDDVRLVAEEHERRTRKFIELTDPRVLRGQPHIESWYPGPDFPEAWCWPGYKQILRDRIPDVRAVESIDSASTKIMAHLPHPNQGTISTRGLVIGHVQSGKTSNYAALIAKAADVGYQLFIVLAGMTSSLRQQTQR